MIDQIKRDIVTAMKQKDETKRNILRLVLTECELIENRGQSVDPVKVIQKLIKSNEETLSYNPGDDVVTKLEKEISIMEEYLPKKLTKADIMTILSPLEEQIVNAKNDGQAIGIAMNTLKKVGGIVDPSEVKTVLGKIRLQSES